MTILYNKFDEHYNIYVNSQLVGHADTYANAMLVEGKYSMVAVGQLVFSADTSSHGCREGWAARVTAVDGDAVTATITSNTHCYSCWQTGCVDDGQEDNDRVGEVITFSVSDCRVDDYDQIVVS